ncbi:MAG: AMP-dependent synthetase and ligase [Hydrocarboniphaga sp.]|uniref:AMP-binding protein n=1 Tax=Hydrocarboniphaga sp. TaxID=2033016 RepID=UPI0026335449|nr:AMP-binding protein [Hydrocarboniphaga sp.]MDB5971630.1 AMP-dependent synthetase and ligase [Hydrocarboniphaga sp.]
MSSQTADATRPANLLRPALNSAADIAGAEQSTPDDVLSSNTIYECIAASAAAAPGKIALSHLLSADPEVAPRNITYSDLLIQIQRAANLFKQLAGNAHSSVSIILPMLPEALIASWAGSTAGISNPINPYLEVKQIVSILNASKATVLVTTTRRHGAGAWDKLDQITGAVPTLQRVLIVDSENPEDDFAAAVGASPAGLTFEPGRDPHAEAVYLPTGGTTAAPKLVRMSHRGQLLNAWTMGGLAGSEPECVVGHAMPNFHVGGSVLLALRAMLFGQTLLTLTTDGFRNAGVVRNFWDLARRHKMSSLIATPATASAILALPDTSSEGHSIRCFQCGGSTIPVELLRGFHSRFGIWLRELWGMSEIHGAVSSHPDDSTQPVSGSVGVHLPWHPVKVVEVDGDNRLVRECAPGERGLLAVGGPGVTMGYVDSRLDKEFFITGMQDDWRWANTGDLGTIDENGYIWMFGRAKDVIVRGGHNIDPKMIEEVLVCHPSVQVAAAIGRPDAAKGEMPIAYVQFKEGAVPPSMQELLELCKRDVQERAAVPVEIIAINAMPMTAVGKINKPALRFDSMRRVATGVAAALLGDSGSCEVVVDETGLRPRVTVRTQLSKGDANAIREQLTEAFRTYEFLTVIEVNEAP